jgi:Membrane-associated lipoprotein involved in thiamine biosynthesis
MINFITVFLEEKGMAIDLGSLAKGYFADLLADYVRSQGAKSALINLGGNVVVVGPKKSTVMVYGVLVSKIQKKN